MHKILIVDDDKITHAFINRALAYKFDIVPTFSGEQGLAELQQNHYDIVLLDVEMPGMNGYEVCEQIRSNPQTMETPVIFLSGRGELRDRMQGFEAGADDYIVKPFYPEDLIAKINVLIQYRLRRHELAQQVEEARKTAFIAISSSSDLGQAINFIEKSHVVSDYEQLARTFFSVTQSMDLKCTIMIKGTEDFVFFSSSHTAVSPMESELIKTLAAEKRFFDFDCRTQINYPHISLLIKNMPLHDMERYGRIKDFFPAMLTTADIKIEQIHSQLAVLNQLNETREAFADIGGLLENIKKGLETNQKHSVKIMRDMLMELDKNLPRMGLHEDQEQYILDRIDKGIEESYQAVTANQQINTLFQSVLENLQVLLFKQQQLQTQLFTPATEESEQDDDEGYQMDIELF
jgi:CheY-like chemotaxis protein